MKKITASSFAILLFVLSTVAQEARGLDANESIIRFEISNFSFNTVEGTLNQFSGVVQLDPQNLEAAKIEICTAVSSIKTGIDKRDEHLQQEEWFNGSAFPRICFSAKTITETNTGYLAHGVLRLKGKSQKITVPFTWENGTIKATFTVNRMDFNIGNETSTFTVGNEVLVNVECNLKP
jgi:polyisoprenoid-binding protein YceI